MTAFRCSNDRLFCFGGNLLHGLVVMSSYCIACGALSLFLCTIHVSVVPYFMILFYAKIHGKFSDFMVFNPLSLSLSLYEKIHEMHELLHVFVYVYVYACKCMYACICMCM